MTDHEMYYGSITTTASNPSSPSINITNTTTNNNSSTSSTTTTVHRSRACSSRICNSWSEEQIAQIGEYYKNVIGTDINCAIGAFLRKCMEAGMEAEVVLDAIEKTGWAKFPSAFYLRAILTRELDQHILTMETVRLENNLRKMDSEFRQSAHRTDWF